MKKLFSLMTVLVLAATAAQATLLLQYNFDEATSGTTAALDSSGAAPAAPGTFTGAATRVATRPDKAALNLAVGTVGTSGNSNYIDPGDVNKVDGLSQMTLTFWLNIQNIPTGNDRLFSDITGASGWELRFSSAGTPTASSFVWNFSVDASGVSPTASAGADNQWMFFALTYDGTAGLNNTKFWQAGLTNAVGQLGSTVNIAGQGAIDANASSFYIGRSNLTAADRTPSVWMDDVRIYDTIFSQSALEQVRLENVSNLVPEPSTILLIGLGGAMLWRSSRKQLFHD